MPETGTRCAKCGNETEHGFLVDTVFPSCPALQFWERQGEELLWASGKRSNIPQRGWFANLVMNCIGFRISRAQTKPVSTLRCVHCGYLELYAK